MRNTDTGIADPSYKGPCKYGGAAALIAAGLILGELIVFAIHPQPGTVREWFNLFQEDRILGLLEFWGLEVLMYGMYALVFPALFIVLRKVDESRVGIALTLALLGIGIFLATNNPFSMLSLSDQYAAAATDVQRSSLLAAGQAVLAGTNQRVVGGFNMGLFLVSIAGLMGSSVMLRSDLFGRSIAILGILAHGLSLADYLRQALTSSTMITLLVILPNALLLVTWYLLVGRRLLQLRRPLRKTIPGKSRGNPS